MIRKALKDICKISTDENINTENYLDAINFIDNLYHAVSILKQDISIKKLIFLPSFKGKYVCEKIGLPADPDENELKILKISSDVFRVDTEITDKITEKMRPLCKDIIFVDNIFIFRLL
jgi:hypothetical protein